jgi:uncharacterized protein
MNINISDIVKTDGASLDIGFIETIDALNTYSDEFVLENPISFKGKLTNIGGILKLDGHLSLRYNTKCFRCLGDLSGELNINIKEDFVKDESNTDVEAYNYQGSCVSLDKALIDSIILELPMKQVCSKSCKGLCQRCGADLNVQSCGCMEEMLNPKMETLKDYFNEKK